MSRLVAWALRAVRRRWLALILLATMSLPIVLHEYSPFARARTAQFDLYQTLLPRARHSAPVLVVAVDEAALRSVGQWPWPRIKLAQLIDRIGEQGAAAIGLDMLLVERDQTSPESLAARLPAGEDALRETLARMTSYDELLAQSVARYRVVLGAAGSDVPAPSAAGGLRTWPVIAHSAEVPRLVRHYPHALSSLPSLQGAASGQGLMNADIERGVVRRVTLVSAVGTTLMPAFGLELLRVAMQAGPIEVAADAEKIAALRVGELRIPTQPAGDIWLHYSAFMPDRYVSASDVLATRVNADTFRNKIVIVALTGVGFDIKTTPRGEDVPGADVHAQLIESFFDRRFLEQPEWMRWLELAILVTFGCALIWAAPRLRRDPAILLAVGLLLLVLLFGIALFHLRGLLFDAFSLIIALATVFSSVIASALVRADHERRATEQSLQLARESAARVAGELEAARRIQLGILPNAATTFPAERRFDLAAALEPARAVGGDLYDFFMLDRDRLFVLIGDVSGKGVPASLLMSIAKALTKSIALRAGVVDAGQVLSQANIEVSRDNPESQFITAFAAVLDAASGLVRYWTAGHDTPFLRDRRGTEQIDRAASGPPLCVLDEFDYHEQQLQLAPGDTLTLFTDGITEAENALGEQFGKARLASCLAALPADSSAMQTLEALHTAVRAFAGDAQASDDLTLLVVRWLGPSSAATHRTIEHEAQLSAP